jgi:hypothetical protein
MESQDEKKTVDKMLGGGKWEVTVEDESAEHIVSIKAGVLSDVSGNVVMTPVDLLETGTKPL